MVIDILDPGFSRSQTAYEFIRVYNGRLFDFEQHYKRLLFSISGQALPRLTEDLQKICQTLIEKNNMESGVFRIYQTPGVDLKGSLFVHADKVPIYHQDTSKVKTSPNFRANPDIKATHYAPAIVAMNTAQNDGFDQVLFTSPEGNLLELAFSNFFAIAGNCLLTPLDGILHGITRKHLLLVSESVGLKPVYRSINIKELHTFKEVFHANTTREVVPITQINDIHFPVHTKTKEIAKALRNRIDALTTKPLPKLTFS